MVQEDQLLTNSVHSDTTGPRKQKHNFQHPHLQEDKSITFYSFKTPILKDFENHFSWCKLHGLKDSFHLTEVHSCAVIHFST